MNDLNPPVTKFMNDCDQIEEHMATYDGELDCFGWLGREPPASLETN